MINIAIICSQSQDREIMASILTKQKDFYITSIGTDGYDALQSARTQHPDIIIMDFNIGGVDSMELVPTIKRNSPSTSFIVLCSGDDHEHINQALRSGISGCLLKNELNSLVPSIQCVYHGGLYLSHSIKNHVLQRLAKSAKTTLKDTHSAHRGFAGKYFSSTEMRIFFGILFGYTDREIAKNLNMCEGAVRNCISRAKNKTGLHNRTQMAILALFIAKLDRKTIRGQLADFS